MAAPWRKVVRIERLPNWGRLLVYSNILECGHSLTFKGEKAWDAQYAEKRRCKECDVPD